MPGKLIAANYSEKKGRMDARRKQGGEVAGEKELELREVRRNFSKFPQRFTLALSWRTPYFEEGTMHLPTNGWLSGVENSSGRVFSTGAT